MKNHSFDKRDIETREDIHLLVDRFYDRVKQDPLIGPVFIGVIKDNWPAHLEKMYRFWETVLLDKHTYHGSPFSPHAQMPLKKVHFERWLKIFYTTLNENFSGAKTEEARWRAEKMADMFLYKIEYYRSHLKA